jgi:hypothetical protein
VEAQLHPYVVDVRRDADTFLAEVAKLNQLGVAVAAAEVGHEHHKRSRHGYWLVLDSGDFADEGRRRVQERMPELVTRPG